MVSDSIRRMGESKTMELAAKALEIKQTNPDFIDLTVGEPDFPTPANIKEAAIKAINENKTKYSVTSGILELKIAFLSYLKNKWDLDYKPDEILVSTGAKQGIFNAVMAIVNEEDEVLLPKPYYPSHLEMINFASADAVLIDTNEKNAFKITPNDIHENVTSKTKALILCNPNNPTGAVYTKEELVAISKAVLDHDLYVIGDEVYEQLTYEGNEHVCFASISPEIKNRTIVCNGVSKAYSMTGWRLGFTAGPSEIIKAMTKLQSHTTSCPNVPAQYAALEALLHAHESVQEMKQEFEKRKNLVQKELNSIKDISFAKPLGAFYYFVNVANYFGKTIDGRVVQNSMDLSEYLLEKVGLAVVPGSGFGVEGYIRISYSNSAPILQKGMQKLKKALYELQ